MDKPINKKPVSDQSRKFEKDFNNTMSVRGVNLTEVDEMLNEKEQSLKKKIFSLAKMESLVFADPKLTTVYNDMAENGEEKYGYHYNETIMNMIFNDYILNSAKYIQKYKMAIPKEKKRRDKSGINQLKKSGEEKMNKEKEAGIEETTGAGSSGAYVGPAVWGSGDLMKTKGTSDAMKKPIWNGGTFIQESTYITNPKGFESYYKRLNENIDMERIQTKEELKQAIQMNGGKLSAEMIPYASGEALYAIAIKIADRILPMSWNDLGDINSMWDYIDENGGMDRNSLMTAVREACSDRLAEEGFDLDQLEENNSVLDNTSTEIIDMLNGYEIESLDHEGIVYVKDGKAFSGNDQREINLDNEGWSNLWKEYIDGEGLYEIEISESSINMDDDDDTVVERIKLLDGTEYESKEYGGTVTIKDGKAYLENDLNLDREGWIRLWDEYINKEELNKNREMGINENHLDNKEDKVAFIVKAEEMLSGGDSRGNDFIMKTLRFLPEFAVNALYKEYEINLKSRGVDPNTIMGGEENIKEYDNYNYPAGADADPNAPWNEIDDETGEVEYEERDDYRDHEDELDENPALATMGAAAATGFGSAVGDKVADKVLGENTDDLIPYEIPTWATSALINSDVSGLEDEDIDKLNDFVDVVQDRHGNADFMMGDVDGDDDLGFRHSNDIDGLGGNVYRMFINPDKIEETEDSLIDDNQTTMANKPEPIGTGGSSIPMGTNDMSEELDMEELNEELNAYSIYLDKMKKVNEERKPSTLVLKDRLGDENKKNFKKDFANSDTKDTIDVEKELMYQDEQTDVGDDPQKLGMDIEKEVLKKTKGEALENVGDSTNLNGKEIPKRNATSKEQEEVDLIRKGLGDFVYDNKPSERFEERMKQDMGDELYDQRQKKMEYNAKAPMYNKDTQPVEDGNKKEQFDKDKKGYSDQMGSIKESMITGRYLDLLNKSRIVDFTVEEVVEINECEDYFKLDLTAFGNSLVGRSKNKKVLVNEGVANFIEKFDFYTDGKKVFKMKTTKTNISEGVEEKEIISEELDKIKHLLGYKPQTFVSTSKVKKTRGF